MKASVLFSNKVQRLLNRTIKFFQSKCKQCVSQYKTDKVIAKGDGETTTTVAS